MTPDDLKAARKRLGMTQPELAAALSDNPDRTPIHQVSIAKWEAGTEKIPHMLARALRELERERRKLARRAT